MNSYKFTRFAKNAVAVICTAVVTAAAVFPGVCFGIDYMEEQEARKLLPIESNEIPDWPEGPAVGAKSAILMEMDTHTILYSKNIHEKLYPASTTKILTSLLAMQNCSLNEDVVISHDAIYDVPLDGSRLSGVDEGDTINLENALYCVLVQSANEIASAVGEHVAGKLGKEENTEAFAKIMNDKAKELGCLNSHFTNANGLFDENHYTTAYDLALIGCEFFGNELLCKISSTPSYHFRLRKTDEDDVWISSKNQLFSGKPYEYEYLLGSKTGFVSQSRQTLISAAEKDGMKLVCVVFVEESPYQFEDTISLFQYGFENFQRISIDDNETRYKIENMNLFDTDNDIFGNSTPLISMESGKYIILPNTAGFSDADAVLDYNDAKKDTDVIATVDYDYSGVPVGSCDIIFNKSSKPVFNFTSGEPSSEIISETESEAESETESSSAESPETSEEDEDNQKVIFINVKKVIVGILITAAAIIIIIFIISTISSYSFSPRAQSSKRIRKRRQENRIAKKQAKKTARWEKKQRRKRLKRRKRF